MQEDKLKAFSATNLTSNYFHQPLRATSSLDSATAGTGHSYVAPRPFSTALGEKREPISPYNSLTDVANLINTSAAALGRTTPSLITTLRAGKTSTGSILEQLRSPSRGPTLPMNSIQRSPSPQVSGYLKNLKQQLKDELKTAVHERRMLLEMRERDKDLFRRPDSDLRALFDLYSNVPDVLLPSAALSSVSRLRRRNLSDSALAQYSPLLEDLPPGFYKSHEMDDFGRPTSSLAEVDPNLLVGHPDTSARLYPEEGKLLHEICLN